MPVRQARVDDIPAILQLIRGLAEYERALPEVVATEEKLRTSFFGQNPQVFAHVATRSKDEKVVGLAVWHLNYSTWLGKHGIYLEDLFVLPEERGQGLGMALLIELAKICVDRGYERLQWWVLDWNEPSIGFYKSIGAVGMDEWTVYRVTGDPLKNLSNL